MLRLFLSQTKKWTVVYSHILRVHSESDSSSSLQDLQRGVHSSRSEGGAGSRRARPTGTDGAGASLEAALSQQHAAPTPPPSVVC